MYPFNLSQVSTFYSYFYSYLDMSRCGFCVNLGFEVAAKSHGVRECWRLASTQCLGCGEYGHTVSRCSTNGAPVRKQQGQENCERKQKMLVTGRVNVKVVRKDTPRPSYNPRQLNSNHQGAFAILAGMNEGSDVVDTPKIEDKVQDEEIPLAKPNILRGAWGNGAPVIGKKVAEPDCLRLSLRLSPRLSLRLSLKSRLILFL